MPSLLHTIEVIDAYVACGGRKHLYAHLDKFGERALYCETDSVIFVQKDFELPVVHCGDALGDMTFELKEGEFISEFLSGGPMNYAYKQ